MNPLAKLFIQGHVLLYRLSGGKLGGTMRGHPVLLLETRGRKSGTTRRVVVAPYIDGDNIYIIASLGGAPRHPAWYHNLKANPDVGVQLGAKQWRAKARDLPEPERTQTWQKITLAMPGFADYQRKTSRVIPVVQLVRVG